MKKIARAKEALQQTDLDEYIRREEEREAEMVRVLGQKKPPKKETKNG